MFSSNEEVSMSEENQNRVTVHTQHVVNLTADDVVVGDYVVFGVAGFRRVGSVNKSDLFVTIESDNYSAPLPGHLDPLGQKRQELQRSEMMVKRDFPLLVRRPIGAYNGYLNYDKFTQE